MLSTESQASSNYLNSSLSVPEFYKIHSNPVEASPSNLRYLPVIRIHILRVETKFR
uniref:Uncharacterized protein n=1 Tax=Meloidogyne enterolobii TaxID=390850 RepID=A0A6V7UMJ6_MELEN|nr:unnamed protein product [Meloidogyne enterolobii]